MRRLEQQLRKYDAPIHISSMENIVKEINTFKDAFEENSSFLQTLCSVIAAIQGLDRVYEVYSYGNVTLVVFDVTDDIFIRGLIYKYPRRVPDISLCRAPRKDHIELITDEGEDSAESVNNEENYLTAFEPISGRGYFLFTAVFNNGCKLKSYVLSVSEGQLPSDGFTTQDAFQNLDSENVQQVLEDLEVLLQNDSLPITSEEVHRAFDQVDVLLEEKNEEVIPGHLLQMLDDLGACLDLKGVGTGAIVRDNLALLAADISSDNPIRGLRVTTSRDHGAFTNEEFNFIRDTDDASPLSNETAALVFLPESITRSSRRISFTVFRNDRAFNYSERSRINSKIISISVENFTVLETGEVVELFFSPLDVRLQRDEARACAYWHFHENGSGYWSQEGCSFVRATKDGELDACRCEHLTHFAQILIRKDVFSETHESVLQIISVVGCGLSFFGIIVIALTAAFFKSWRSNESNQIWLQLCTAVFILDVCFVVVVFVNFNTYDIGCVIVGVALHYSVLATFSWMTVVAILSYRKLVIVFSRNIPRKVFIASCFSWGFPLLVIGVLLLVDVDSYRRKYEEKSPSASFCYPSGLALWLTVYGPISLMWVVNWTLYALITKSMYIDKKIRRHSGTAENFQTASASCLLAFLCGVPWFFGFFAYNIVAAYLFTFTVCFQGFVLFLFFVLGTMKTRRLWVNLFRTKVLRNPDRSEEHSSSRRSTVKARFYVPKPPVPESITLLNISK